MAETFHELHGDYVENGGQELSLREYLDYFEPLGSALARLPDGTGGPFVHHFTDSGGRTISALGWVVSARSKRFGGWTLWGTWTDRPMPAIALPIFWPVLADSSRVGEWVHRANDNAELLTDSDRWSELLRTLKAPRLREEPFRELLKAELARAYAVPLPHRHPLEIEVAPQTVDLLPWLYLLGPVDPATARLLPNRFNGPGYQYILTESLPSGNDVDIPREIESIVDTAAKNIGAAVRLATELRSRRERPPMKPTKPARPRERSEMRSPTPAPVSPPSDPARPPALPLLVDALWKLAVLVLLAWIAWNVHLIRKAGNTQPATSPSTTVTSAEETPAPSRVEPATEPESTNTRIRRLANVLQTRPPRGIRVNAAALDEIQTGGADAEAKLARVAIEIFLRRNRCYPTTEAPDARLATAELRATRTCTSLQTARLMQDRTTPDNARAIQWLEETIAP